jgi:hypothetical protein
MCNLLVHVFRRILMTLISLLLTVQLTTHLTRRAEPMTDEFDLFQRDFTPYSQLMSQMTLDLGADTSGTQYEAPHASSYDTPSLSTRVPKTQAPADAKHERPRCEIRPRDTYNLSLIRRMLHRR